MVRINQFFHGAKVQRVAQYTTRDNAWCGRMYCRIRFKLIVGSIDKARKPAPGRDHTGPYTGRPAAPRDFK